MAAIAGESLFYEVSRVLSNNYRLSYYQYRALSSFAEMISLHDHVALFVGDETDKEFLESFDWLVNIIHEKSDFKIDIVFPQNRSDYITSDELKQFEAICKDIYPHPLGITSDELFTKLRKDRTGEDMSERIERMFCEKYPKFDSNKFAEDIYTVWLDNANSSELLYFFRAHLLQAIAETKHLTPIFENQRLIAAALQNRNRQNSRVGTLSFAIYKMVDSLFIQACDLLPDEKNSYPRVSLFLNAIIGSITRRDEMLNAIFNLRVELKDFRFSYKKIEEVLINPNLSLSDRSEVKEQLEESVKKVWIPTISSLGRHYTPNAVKKIAKNVFEKYGIGEVKAEHLEKKDASENSIALSTPSLIGIGATVAQTISEVYKDSKLTKPNRALLDVLNRVVKLTASRDKLTEILPVNDFTYRTSKLLDSILAEKAMEVTK
jgi:hypothetical protein